MIEHIDVLDETGNKTGEVWTKKEIYQNGLWHRMIRVWVMNKENQFLMQKRMPNKSYPNAWDLSCGGHVSAGDDSLTTAVRELAEELGIQASKDDLEYLGEYKDTSYPFGRGSGLVNNGFYDVYLLRGDYQIKDFKTQADEVAEIKYVELDDAKKAVDMGMEYCIIDLKEIQILERVLKK